MYIDATLVRGGTSKCWLFRGADVPQDREKLEALLIAAYGASDLRQIDGVGGATSTTSKAAVVSPSDNPEFDIDYLFAQVGIGNEVVEWESNCGNCATAIALYSVREGLVPVTGDATRVRMFNLNTGTRLDGIVATPGGKIPTNGSASVPGTDAVGVKVGVSFLDPAGATTGRFLPTGNLLDTIAVHRELYRATLLDAGAPMALFDARDLNSTGTEGEAGVNEMVATLSTLRAEAAIHMGLRERSEPVQHAVPKVGIVGAPRDYVTSQGATIAAQDYDLSVRMLSMHKAHPAIGLTSAVGIALGTSTPGTTLNHLASPHTSLRIGTLSGVVNVSVRNNPDPTCESWRQEVVLERAARVIADARIHLPLIAI